MKTQIRNFVMGAGLAALLWSPLLMAQNVETAEIPFDFHAVQSALPAGTYDVIKTGMSGILQLRNEDTGDSIFLSPQGREQANRNVAPKLSFRCYGGDCYLSAVWMPDSLGYTFPKTDREKEIAKAGGQATTKYVALLARR
jgi:hypothetical protein